MKNYPLFTERQRAVAAEAVLHTPDKPKMECVLRSYQSRRSRDQENRHWARMEQFAYWMNKRRSKNTEKEHWHYYFAGEVFGWVKVSEDGKAIPAQTKWRNKFQYSEMEAFIDEKADDWDIPLMDKKEWHEYKRAAGI